MTFKPNQTTFDEKLSALIGLVVGLLFLSGGVWVRHLDAHEQATLIETQGTVVDSVSRRERDTANASEKTTYAPIVEFWVNGDRTRFTGPYESYRPGTDQKVVVRYDPNQPTTSARVVPALEGLTAWGMFGMGGLAVFWSLGPLLPIRWDSSQ
jgi:Protein of unknown function (DUF3592)